MEAFSLLRYWCTTAGTTTTLFTKNAAAFDGPYFDLDFQQLTSNSTQTQAQNGGDHQGILKSATGFRVLLLNLKSDSNDEREVVRGKMVTVNFDFKGAKGPLVSRFSETNLGKHNMLKPFYIRLQKMKLSDYTPCNNLQAWVNVMRKHLGKSRSTPPPPGKMGSNRRQELDEIQGAILHCKRSFNS